MAASVNSTPLLALRAVVLDTETTGLDARAARLVQIGAVRVANGTVSQDDRFETLVNPGVPIPPTATNVHGISDADVADAPTFAAVARQLDAFIGDAILVGHTIGFDLSILQREFVTAGLSWKVPRPLDVRMLAELALPTLAQYDLDGLAHALGVDIVGRHSAMGDARATAAVYHALIPLLRHRGIRTLAEAEAASRTLVARLAGAAQQIYDVRPGTAHAVSSVLRVDSFTYRHSVQDVMTAPAVWCEPTATVGAAIRLLLERKISSVLINDAQGQPGIATERDFLRVIDKAGHAGLEAPASAVASRPLHTISADTYVYRAIGRLERMNVRHLPVNDDGGEIIGMVTTRNLLRHRATTAVMLGDQIDIAPSAASLADAWAQLPVMAKSLVEEAVEPNAVAAVISAEICALTRRAAELAEQRMRQDGKGGPPCPYALLVLGSAGRGESLLAADQDNAIVYAHGEPGGPEDGWFEALGRHIADLLDEVGVPYCKGGVMARNAEWRRSIKGWQVLIEDWIRRQRPEDLLNVDIFFDAVVVHGDHALAEQVMAHAFTSASGRADFLNRLTESARHWRAPLSLFGGLKSDPDGRIDLKLGGLLPIVSSARVLAIGHGIRSGSTPDRLRAVHARGIGSENDVNDVIDAHRTIMGAMINQQLSDSDEGVPLSPRVRLKPLSPHAKAELKRAVTNVNLAVALVGEGRI